MLALAVACPAVADPVWDSLNNSTTHPNGFDLTYVTSNNEATLTNTSVQSGYIGNSANAASCDATPLTFRNNAPGSGTFTFTASWSVDECTIDLDPNIAGGGDESNDEPFKTLYSRYDSGAYLEEQRTHLMGLTTNGLTNIPLGKVVTTTWNISAPSGHTASDVTPTSYSNSTPRRAFLGFFPTTSSTTEYISGVPNSGTNQYHITQAGINAARLVKKVSGSCPETTWHARWDCATRTFPEDPVLPGYEFLGWYTSATGGTQVTATCTTSGDNLYTHWRARDYNVKYQCGTGASYKSGIQWLSTTNGTDKVTFDDSEHPYTFRTPVDTCEKAGSTPTGWTCTMDDTAATLPTGVSLPWEGARTWDVPSDVTCVANWAGLHNLTYNCNNGGLGDTPDGDTYPAGETISVLSNTNAGGCNEPDGKHFNGWVCTNYAGCNTGQSCSITAPDDDITCTGQWEWNEINLIWTEYDDNDSVANTSCTYNSAYNTTGAIGGTDGGAMPTPQREGYTFEGWIVTGYCNDNDDDHANDCE